MNKGKLIIIFMIGSMLLIHSGHKGWTNNDFGIKIAPLNEAFIRFIATNPPGIPSQPALNKRGGGWIPPSFDLAHVEGEVDDRVNTTYPAYYDLRDVDGKLPPVQDQDGYPACWSFAVYCSLETCLRPDQAKDFSEWHLYNNHGFDRPEGGNAEIATAYMARWAGPVDESDAPYGSTAAGSGQLNPTKHVQQVMFLPKRNGPLDNNTTKWFIMNYGAIYTGIRYDRDSFSNVFSSLYLRWDDEINHGVAIVGWDDNFPADHFVSPAPGNGAFIARNSWGQDYGENGHFYISYYDAVVIPKACFNNAEDVTNYGAIYQYDPFGATLALGRSGEGPATMYWGANIFTAINDQPIEAVSFYTTDANAECEIYVYKNNSANSPVDGELAAQHSVGFAYPGYYTVRLNTPVFLNRGQRFSVVVQFTNSSFPFPVPIETPVSGYITSNHAEPGESYISGDGIHWKDLTLRRIDSNVCIKALSRTIQSQINLSAHRETVSSWLADIDYGVLNFSVQNLQEVPISKLIIYRKEENGVYLVLDEITEAEGGNFQNLTYIDKSRLRRDQIYTYQIAAVNATEAICGLSNEQAI